MSLKISHQGYIIVAIPLLFELAVFGFVLNLNNQAEMAASRARESRRINDEINAIIQSIYSMSLVSRGMSFNGLPTMMEKRQKGPATLTSGMNITKSATQLAAAEKAVLFHIETLKQLERNNPQALETVENTEKAAYTARNHLNELMVKIASTDFTSLPAILKEERRTLDLDLVAILSRELLDLANPQIRDDEEEAAARARKLSQRVLFAAVAFSILLAFLGASLFSNRIALRLGKLKENAVRLAQLRPLLPPIGGNDEISELDTSFHEAARMLGESEEKLQNTFDNAADLICSLNEQLGVELVNKTCERLLDVSATDLVGTRLVQYLSENSRTVFLEAIAAAKQTTDQAVSTEIQLKKRNGELVQTICIPKWVPSEKTFFCVFHDISERKEAEEIKREVFAMVSHDLRTPVTSFGHFTEMLESGAFGELNEKGNRFLKFATSSVSRMEKLLEDIMTIERIRAKTIRVSNSSISVSEVLCNVSEPMLLVAQNKGVLIEVSESNESIYSDQSLLEKILSNFLSNALKVAPTNSRVKLSFRNEQSKNVFSVQDEGPGIPQEKIARLFDKFYSEETGGNHDLPSSGLGLTIAKELANLLKAHIEVNSKVGSGTTFRLILDDEANG